MTACLSEKRTPEEEGTVETVLPDATNEVTVMTLTATDFRHELVSNGKLAAARCADLRFGSDEPVAAIYVKNGDRVSRGQAIAELAAFRLENRAAQARDALDKAKLDMQDVLIGQGFAPEDSANVPPATLALVESRSGYRQALAQYELALYEVRNAVLRAPFDGVIANLSAKPFNRASTSETFCTVIDPHSLEAVFSVLENELPLIKTGDRVVVTPYATPSEGTEGRIREINPFVDAGGLVRVKAAVAAKGRMFEGMKVRVTVQRLLGGRWVVPKSAVVIRSGRQVLFALKDGKARWVYVHTDLENSGSYAVSSDTAGDLKEGDLIITSGNVNLAHESPVSVKDSMISQ
ncbi:MAG: efflux RND transporter periplasmic adaptor subunit [Tannerella sp.]|nr:efflux RND transporter periplasmic adaptor subunit [Tannerella sp.]